MTRNKKVKIFAAGLEVIGVIVTSAGVVLEITMGGEVHLVVITCGAVVVAAGAMVWAKCVHEERKAGG